MDQTENVVKIQWPFAGHKLACSSQWLLFEHLND
jgi:hypothetical protein